MMLKNGKIPENKLSQIKVIYFFILGDVVINGLEDDVEGTEKKYIKKKNDKIVNQ